MDLSIILDNDQLDEHLFYFAIRLLQSSTCTRFEHYVLIIRRLNCVDAASGIVLPFSGRPMQNLCTGRPLTGRTLPDAASTHFNLLMMSI